MFFLRQNNFLKISVLYELLPKTPPNVHYILQTRRFQHKDVKSDEKKNQIKVKRCEI